MKLSIQDIPSAVDLGIIWPIHLVKHTRLSIDASDIYGGPIRILTLLNEEPESDAVVFRGATQDLLRKTEAGIAIR